MKSSILPKVNFKFAVSDFVQSTISTGKIVELV